ncbi:MAG: rhomboid family intramembrane serine protease [Opitutaceae bacterium]
MSLLRKMIPSNAMNGLWQRARMGSHPKKHRCPGCNRKMEEISVEAEGQTRAIDVCTTCQFVWLDEGEWADLAFFKVEKASPEAIRETVRKRIAETRRARNAPPSNEATVVMPPPVPKSSPEPQQPPKLKPRAKPVSESTHRGVVHNEALHGRSHSASENRDRFESPRARHASSKSKRQRASDRERVARYDMAESRRRSERNRLDESKRQRRREAPKRRSGWGEGPSKSWQWIPALFGMPVEDEQPTGPRQHDDKPWLTWILAGGIVLVSLLAMLDLRAVVDAYGLIPEEYGRKGGLTWLTAFFLHGGLIHLIGNVYFLIVFGDNVEKCLGTIEFFLLLCLATMSGHLVHILLDPHSAIPCIGASGGISGVLAFYALRFRQNQLAVVFWFFFKTYWLRMSALPMFGIWVVLQFFIASQQVMGISNISGGAHLGGALAGVFVWLVWRFNQSARHSSEGSWSTK